MSSSRRRGHSCSRASEEQKLAEAFAKFGRRMSSLLE